MLSSKASSCTSRRTRAGPSCPIPAASTTQGIEGGSPHKRRASQTHAEPAHRLGRVAYFSLAITPTVVPSKRSASWIAVLCPSSEGKPILLLMIGSIRIAKIPPQPVAPGAENSLLTSTFFGTSTNSNSSLKKISPLLPLIEVLGGFGCVLPVVRFSCSGLELEPM